MTSGGGVAEQAQGIADKAELHNSETEEETQDRNKWLLSKVN
jgi:hypothetical protein